MGCDIRSFAEVKRKGNWEKVGDHFSLDEYDKKYYKKDKGENPFDWRSYTMFSFLADVRNRGTLKPICEPKGVPTDLSEEISDEYDSWYENGHSASHLTLKELIDFNYNKISSENETYKDTLGEWFFKHLDELKLLGEPESVRVVFCFDN